MRPGANFCTVQLFFFNEISRENVKQRDFYVAPMTERVPSIANKHAAISKCQGPGGGFRPWGPWASRPCLRCVTGSCLAEDPLSSAPRSRVPFGHGQQRCSLETPLSVATEL